MTLSKHMQIKEVLSHPMLLLIAGAVISSLIIPYFTRQWQDHQHELDLKSDLSDQINKAVTNMLTAATLNLNPGYNKNNTQRFLSAYIDFQTSKDIIGSKMKLYFSDNQLANKWDNVSNAVINFVGLSTSSISPSLPFSYGMCLRLGHVLIIHASLNEIKPININRNTLNLYHCNNYYIPGLENAQQIQTYTPINNGGINWNALFLGNLYAPTSRTGQQTEYVKSFYELKDDITNYKNNLLIAIFNSEFTAYR